mgnify:CR=1 FL=1
MKKRILISATAVVILFTTVSFKSDFFEIAKQIEIFTTLFKELNMNYVDEVNPGQLMDSAIEGMLADLDPYTKYWTEQEVEDARISNSGEYTGIGASVLTRNKTITILEAYKDYPADVMPELSESGEFPVGVTTMEVTYPEAAMTMEGEMETRALTLEDRKSVV